MIISPLFLPIRANGTADADYVAAAMPVAATNCPGTSNPEGSFPVSLQLGWHGGIHLHAPSTGATVLPVRAIADGELCMPASRLWLCPTPPIPLITIRSAATLRGRTMAW